MTSEQLYLDVLSVILEMHKETAYNRLSPNKEKMINMIEYCHKQGFLYFNGECLMLGKAYTPWYNDDKHVSDILLYTRSASRGEGLATKAVEAYMKWAKSIDATDIQLSQSTGITSSEFNALATKFNLVKIGEVFHVR